MAHLSPNDTGAEAESIVDCFHLCERSNLRYRGFMASAECL
jgi:hypothetical protein